MTPKRMANDHLAWQKYYLGHPFTLPLLGISRWGWSPSRPSSFNFFSFSKAANYFLCYVLFGPAPILILGVLVFISQFLVLACSPLRPWNHWREQSSLFSRKFYIWSQVSTFRSNEMFACLDIFSDAWIPAVFQVCLPSAADELVLRVARSSEAKPTLTSQESLCLSCSTHHMLPTQ